jgi:hypothetical protein
MQKGVGMLNEREVVKLYVATFNRAPDTPGLWYWVYDSGLPLEGVAESFFQQPETQALYPPGSSTETFIKAVYRNLFNREPEQEGMEYWREEIDSGRIPRGRFILAVINGAQGADAQILDNKTDVGSYFALHNISDIQLARKVLENIDENEESVTSAMKMIDNYIISHGGTP